MSLRSLLIDRKHRVPRLWSNQELQKIAPLCTGDVVNVSGWRDEDKAGRHYRDYFSAASSYTITNYKAEARGLQGTPGELFLDLEQTLDPSLHGRFDVVFNHTVLEHVFEVDTAFKNLCAMSRDLVVVVVPFLQPMHADYGDFWRFSPMALERLFAKNGLTMIRATSNRDWLASVYVVAVGARHPERWRGVLDAPLAFEDTDRAYDGLERLVGSRAVPNFAYALARLLRRRGEGG
ncbi:MAG TPA: hypothetical protein VGF99_00310 [Myxococcota bacterium]